MKKRGKRILTSSKKQLKDKCKALLQEYNRATKKLRDDNTPVSDLGKLQKKKDIIVKALKKLDRQLNSGKV